MLWDPSKRVCGGEPVKILTLQVLKGGYFWKDCYSVSHLIAILEDVLWDDRYQQSGHARTYNYCVIISHLSYKVTCFHKVWSCFLHSNHIAWGTWSRVKLLHCRIQWSLSRQMLHFCYHVVISFLLSMYLRSQKAHEDANFALSFCKWTQAVRTKVVCLLVGYFSILLIVTCGRW